jgi:hypothetical protein
VELFASVAMPNHWHLVVRPRRAGDVGKFGGAERGRGKDVGGLAGGEATGVGGGGESGDE